LILLGLMMAAMFVRHRLIVTLLLVALCLRYLVIYLLI
jgi:hypothetical protein